MSSTFTLSGNTSILSTNYFPPIELDRKFEYVLGLVDLQTYNSIPNVHEKNNRFYYNDEVVIIPEGSYEIDDIYKYINNTISKNKSLKYFLTINANNNTLKCEIISSLVINFEKENNIGSLLGFKKKILQPNTNHISDLPIDILGVSSIQIDCNIIRNSYRNNQLIHIIHQFFPVVPPGYKIVEIPSNVIYLPVNVHTINNITLKLIDQNDKLINFRGENITIRLELKKISKNGY